MNLSAVLCEIISAPVSIVSRLLSDYAFWTPIEIGSLVLLVCEEAQR